MTDIPTRKKLVEILRPFWREREKLYDKFAKMEAMIEARMTDSMESYAGISLSFFYCDGGCVGIGATDLKDVEKFPLIHDSELEDER